MKSFFLFVFLLASIGCSKKPTESVNLKPTITISYALDDSEITLSGSIKDKDGTVSKMIIDWGDGNISNPTHLDFAQFEVTHDYEMAGTYLILVTGIDNDSDTSFYSFTVEMNFIANPLEGIKESIFKTSDKEYLVLTINLHTYQESEQAKKLEKLIDVIGQLDIDFIALQECAQHKSSPITSGIIREDNMALIISNRLQEKYNLEYNFVWNWAHYGWNVWEEGVAVLSKHPLIDTDEKYISSNTSTNNILSRKVIYGAYQIPEGMINVFSAHTHWRTSETDDEQNSQIQNIKDMASDKENANHSVTTFICGDFNGNPTSSFPWSEGYQTMMENAEYEDTFLEVFPNANNTPAQSIYNTVGGTYPGRIDYIFSRNNGAFEIADAQIIFTNTVSGKISDHNGVLTKVIYTP